ncbi:MAG: sugar transferase [Beijerinckiaceae bacterium]|jgi:lipopolysaccharide/colanic/teichoic acid biosynthesis glycosyltransferase/cellulose synthase/poly-beta-1,6-N-acetylglucosamine synthase-like glycosyltransferase|nr:sugar transferase [Beijerinckiaceae bacterium]
MSLFWILLAISLALLAYHHLVYPLWLRAIPLRPPHSASADGLWPTVGIVVPAYREAAHIEAMIRQLAALDYPRDRLEILVVCDGSPDDTAERARGALASLAGQDHAIRLVDHPVNRGKVAVLNDAIAALHASIVVLFDASSIVPVDTLLRLVPEFRDPGVGVVCPAYGLAEGSAPGEHAYWRYQQGIRRREAAFAAPMGAHGAGYAFRKAAWAPLPPQTINDDFVLPMRIVAAGFRLVDRPDIVIGDREVARAGIDRRRRRRLGAGNLQQVLLCHRLLWASGWRMGLLFASGKALRAMAPLLLLAALASSVGLAATSTSRLDLVPLIAAEAIGILALMADRLPQGRLRMIAGGLRYALGSYFAMARGILDLAIGRFDDDRRKTDRREAGATLVLSPVTRGLKRVFDIAIALLAFLGLLLVGPLIALALRLDSPGPIFYRQLRVGRALPDRTDLFHLIKFRTMRVDAEAGTGAVWAAKGDPRVTRLGRFLRKTRLDELPQCLNVLRGEMSIVGPRPERPVFFSRLEAEIPFYVERTFGLKPGVTGLAQVSTGYDATIDDVRLKILFDHSYALKVQSPLAWLRTDLAIIAKTFLVMGLGMGR